MHSSIGSTLSFSLGKGFHQPRKDYLSDSTASQFNFDIESLCKVSEFEASTNSKGGMPKTRKQNKIKRAISWLCESGFISKEESKVLKDEYDRKRGKQKPEQKREEQSDLDFKIYRAKSILYLGEPSKPKPKVEKTTEISKLAKNLENFIKLVRLKKKLNTFSKESSSQRSSDSLVNMLDNVARVEALLSRTLSSSDSDIIDKNLSRDTFITSNNEPAVLEQEGLIPNDKYLDEKRFQNNLEDISEEISTEMDGSSEYHDAKIFVDGSTQTITNSAALCEIWKRSSPKCNRGTSCESESSVGPEEKKSNLIASNNVSVMTQVDDSSQAKMNASTTTFHSAKATQVRNSHSRNINLKVKTRKSINLINRYIRGYKRFKRMKRNGSNTKKPYSGIPLAITHYKHKKEEVTSSGDCMDLLRTQLENKYRVIREEITKYLNTLSLTKNCNSDSKPQSEKIMTRAGRYYSEPILPTTFDAARRLYTVNWVSTCASRYKYNM